MNPPKSAVSHPSLWQRPQTEREPDPPLSAVDGACGEEGWVRCLAHGFPSPLARWHSHDEYELHLITHTSGRAFVGDWVGRFEPGQLVLCGPRLPHNWVSMDVPIDGVPQRDRLIQFRHEPIALAATGIPELADLMQVLDRARRGVEFFGLSERANEHWTRVKDSHGLRRITALGDYLADLVACRDYRILCSEQIRGTSALTEVDQISAIVSRITTNCTEPITLSEIAAELGFSESRFSRIFRRCTGVNFTDFVNRIRVGNACHLLMQTDHLVTDIGHRVGFKNTANFNRRFLEVKGMTPREFRRYHALLKSKTDQA